MVFRSKTPILESTLIRAKKANAEWRIRYKLTIPLQTPIPNQSGGNRKKIHWVAWRKPQRGCIKINFDGSKTLQAAAEGFLLRNWEARFIQAASFYLGVASVLVEKATTMRNDIRAALQVGFTDREQNPYPSSSGSHPRNMGNPGVDSRYSHLHPTL